MMGTSVQGEVKSSEMKSPLGPLVSGRSCGECTACCSVPEIDFPELKKPARVLCQHSSGTGCGIYDHRPAGCRDFYCVWRHIEAMPDRTRPDQLGMMFVLRAEDRPKTVFENLYIVGWPVETPDVMSKPDVQRSLAMFARDIFPVFVQWEGQSTLLYPDKTLAWAITDMDAVRDPALKARADKWLRDYAPYARIQAGDKVLLPPGY
ncbi:MAG TPA: hypothetical protein VL574_07750 [Stellaceae bacterium]|jgi:hypothetical protein|nr:hypothetical protein [Stellaceae bacterium]